MSAQAQIFTADLPADSGLLRDLRQQLVAWLEAASVAGQTRDAIVLAAHEAAANAIEHAAAPVSVVGRVEPDVILIEVTSIGRWAAHPQVSSDERGRGLALMRGLLSDVEILAEEERTIVRLRMIRSEHTGPEQRSTESQLGC
jgi:anti-sigma regulatory factor (Ser/Thr protein kinase)